MINPLGKMYPKSPDPILQDAAKELAIQGPKAKYKSHSVPRFAHINKVIDKVNEIIIATGSGTLMNYRGVLTSMAFPAATPGDAWTVPNDGTICTKEYQEGDIIWYVGPGDTVGGCGDEAKWQIFEGYEHFFEDSNAGTGTTVVMKNDAFPNTGTGVNGFATGSYTKVDGNNATATGFRSIAKGDASHAEGWNTLTLQPDDHAEGGACIASGEDSHAEGEETLAGNWFYAEYDDTTFTFSIFGDVSSSFLINDVVACVEHPYVVHTGIVAANAVYVPADNATIFSTTLSLGIASTSLLLITSSNASASTASHAEGSETVAGNVHTHAEGENTYALVYRAHSEGHRTVAGIGVIANYDLPSLTFSIPNTAITSEFSVGDSIIAINGSGVKGSSFVESIAFNPLTNATDVVVGNTLGGSETSILIVNKTKSDAAYKNTAHSEGAYTIASGSNAHSEGYKTQALGPNSHAEGEATITVGQHSHAEGYTTKSSGQGSHSEGMNTISAGIASHAENIGTYSGIRVHAYDTSISGIITLSTPLTDLTSSFTVGDKVYIYPVMGNRTYIREIAAVDYGVTVPGRTAITLTDLNFTMMGAGRVCDENKLHEGSAVDLKGDFAHSEGGYTIAGHSFAHAEGAYTKALHEAAHAEGYYTNAYGQYSHAEGSYTNANNAYAHAEGYSTIADGESSHSEGNYSIANADNSHAQNTACIAGYPGSHAEGVISMAADAFRDGVYTDAVAPVKGVTFADVDLTALISTGDIVAVIDVSGQTIASQNSTVTAIDYNITIPGATVVTLETALGANIPSVCLVNLSTSGAALGTSHAEGFNTISKGQSSHSEGDSTIASGYYGAHAEGFFSHAEGNSSHAGGQYSHTKNINEFARGKVSDTYTSQPGASQYMDLLLEANIPYSDGTTPVALTLDGALELLMPFSSYTKSSWYMKLKINVMRTDSGANPLVACFENTYSISCSAAGVTTVVAGASPITVDNGIAYTTDYTVDVATPGAGGLVSIGVVNENAGVNKPIHVLAKAEIVQIIDQYMPI